LCTSPTDSCRCLFCAFYKNILDKIIVDKEESHSQKINVSQLEASVFFLKRLYP
jgi:hypothetical protein